MAIVAVTVSRFAGLIGAIRGAMNDGNESGVASQIVRFARPAILFYDGNRIDLYQSICALYLMARRYRHKGNAHRNLSSPLGRTSERIQPDFQLKGPF